MACFSRYISSLTNTLHVFLTHPGPVCVTSLKVMLRFFEEMSHFLFFFLRVSVSTTSHFSQGTKKCGLEQTLPCKYSPQKLWRFPHRDFMGSVTLEEDIYCASSPCLSPSPLRQISSSFFLFPYFPLKTMTFLKSGAPFFSSNHVKPNVWLATLS